MNAAGLDFLAASSPAAAILLLLAAHFANAGVPSNAGAHGSGAQNSNFADQSHEDTTPKLVNHEAH
jgi:hypothetical protein